MRKINGTKHKPEVIKLINWARRRKNGKLKLRVKDIAKMFNVSTEPVIYVIKKFNIKYRDRKQKFCKMGHNLEKVGRANGRTCAKCRKEYLKNYTRENRKRIIKIAVRRQIERRKEDPQFHLACRLRGRLYRFLIGKSYKKPGSAVKDLGCTLDYLVAYIQNKFYNGMTWDNWRTYWELDHVIPLFKFDLTNKEQFLKAVNYKNLQPLTIPDHKKKSAKEAKLKKKFKWH